MCAVWHMMSQDYVWRCLVWWVFPKDVVFDNITTKHYFILQSRFRLSLERKWENMTDLFTSCFICQPEMEKIWCDVSSYIIMDTCANVCWKSKTETGKHNAKRTFSVFTVQRPRSKTVEKAGKPQTAHPFYSLFGQLLKRCTQDHFFSCSTFWKIGTDKNKDSDTVCMFTCDSKFSNPLPQSWIGPWFSTVAEFLLTLVRSYMFTNLKRTFVTFLLDKLTCFAYLGCKCRLVYLFRVSLSSP